MSFDARETVAIVGGGHAFGKAHGACLNKPCGDGKGKNTFTSGFEGPWTTNPAKWDNEFFQNLFNFKWIDHTGPGGNLQWKPVKEDGTEGPDIMMLTSDLALGEHPLYRDISMEYAKDIHSLEKDFAAAWYVLYKTSTNVDNRSRETLKPFTDSSRNNWNITGTS